jgi:hypothetical protein
MVAPVWQKLKAIMKRSSIASPAGRISDEISMFPPVTFALQKHFHPVSSTLICSTIIV